MHVIKNASAENSINSLRKNGLKLFNKRSKRKPMNKWGVVTDKYVMCLMIF